MMPRSEPAGQILPSHFFVILSRASAKPACLTESCQHELAVFVLPHRPQNKHPCQVEIVFSSVSLDFFVFCSVTFHFSSLVAKCERRFCFCVFQKDRFYFLTHTATVRDVELLTGLRFFSKLPVEEAARLRTRLTDSLWNDVSLWSASYFSVSIEKNLTYFPPGFQTFLYHA